MPKPVTVPEEDQTLWRPVGPLAEGDCQAEDDNGEQSCPIRPAWRLTVADEVAVGPSQEHERARELWVSRDAATWLVCSPHLGSALVLSDEAYGGPVLVEVHHG